MKTINELRYEIDIVVCDYELMVDFDKSTKGEYIKYKELRNSAIEDVKELIPKIICDKCKRIMSETYEGMTKCIWSDCGKSSYFGSVNDLSVYEYIIEKFNLTEEDLL